MKKQFTLEKTGSVAFLTKIFLFVERIVWFIGVGIAIMIFLFGYSFVLIPQYNRLVEVREDDRRIELEEYKKSLEDYKTRLNRFIDEMSSVTDRELSRINLVLPPKPDILILNEQLNILFNNYNLSSLTFSVSSDARKEEAAEALNNEEAIDPSLQEQFLSGIGENLPFGAGALSVENIEEAPQVQFDDISVNVSFTASDYFSAKDIIADLEKKIPIMDAETVSITVAPAGEASVTLTFKTRFLKG